jgi:hypothetical protein
MKALLALTRRFYTPAQRISRMEQITTDPTFARPTATPMGDLSYSNLTLARQLQT